LYELLQKYSNVDWEPEENKIFINKETTPSLLNQEIKEKANPSQKTGKILAIDYFAKSDTGKDTQDEEIEKNLEKLPVKRNKLITEYFKTIEKRKNK
jgi:hypothetical protein